MAGKIKHWSSRVGGPPQARELLEIRRDILEDIRDAIEPAGEGRSIFPYNNIMVRIAAADQEQASLFQAAFAEGNALESDVHELLAEAGCLPPAGFVVAATTVEDPALAVFERPFRIDYSTRKGQAKTPGTRRPAARLTVIRGAADAPEYEIRSDRVNIGRMKEVVDEKDGLRRRNDIAFAETETSVSREHAYIRYDAEIGQFRLYDNRSQRGASVFRDGRRLEAPRGAGRGLQLRSGDEIHLGEARLLFEMEQGTIPSEL
jgi:FHA domain